MHTASLFELRKFLLPEIVYGKGARHLAGRHAANFGATKVFIVTDKGVQAAGWPADILKSLENAGIPFAVFADTTENPKDYEVMQGAEVYREEKCDLILAVGGGSPMDCAKGIGVVVGNDEPVGAFEGIDAVANPGPPLIFVPTTAGTSADVSQFAIITDTTRKVKTAIVSKMVIPDIALVDPETTLSMSAELTASTGMDALCHAFESYVSTASSPLTDMAALRAVHLIAANIAEAYSNPGDLRFRDQMMMASLMAGLAFSNASLGLVHAMAHSLGGALDLAHGECNAIILEEAVRFNYQFAEEKYNDLARALGVPIEAMDKGAALPALIEAIASLRNRLGIHHGLKEMGVRDEKLPQLAGFAFKDPCLATNPRPASAGDIEDIYRKLM